MSGRHINPAFPRHFSEDIPGMTYHDWLVGQFVAAFLVTAQNLDAVPKDERRTTFKNVVGIAREIADAVCEVREEAIHRD